MVDEDEDWEWWVVGGEVFGRWVMDVIVGGRFGVDLVVGGDGLWVEGCCFCVVWLCGVFLRSFFKRIWMWIVWVVVGIWCCCGSCWVWYWRCVVILMRMVLMWWCWRGSWMLWCLRGGSVEVSVCFFMWRMLKVVLGFWRSKVMGKLRSFIVVISFWWRISLFWGCRMGVWVR